MPSASPTSPRHGVGRQRLLSDEVDVPLRLPARESHPRAPPVPGRQSRVACDRAAAAATCAGSGRAGGSRRRPPRPPRRRGSVANSSSPSTLRAVSESGCAHARRASSTTPRVDLRGDASPRSARSAEPASSPTRVVGWRMSSAQSRSSRRAATRPPRRARARGRRGGGRSGGRARRPSGRGSASSACAGARPEPVVDRRPALALARRRAAAAARATRAPRGGRGPCRRRRSACVPRRGSRRSPRGRGAGTRRPRRPRSSGTTPTSRAG